MPGFQPQRGFTPVHDARPFWLFNVLQTVSLAIVSYFVAVFLFLVLARITELPQGGVWDEGGFRGPLFFVLMAIVVGILSVPYWQKEFDASIRTLSLFSATFLVAYAVFHATGALDPNVPLDAFVHYVMAPLRKTLGF